MTRVQRSRKSVEVTKRANPKARASLIFGLKAVGSASHRTVGSSAAYMLTSSSETNISSKSLACAGGWWALVTAFETVIESVCPESKDKMDANASKEDAWECDMRSCKLFFRLVARSTGLRRARVLHSKFLPAGSTHHHRIRSGNGTREFWATCSHQPHHSVVVAHFRSALYPWVSWLLQLELKALFHDLLHTSSRLKFASFMIVPGHDPSLS